MGSRTPENKQIVPFLGCDVRMCWSEKTRNTVPTKVFRIPDDISIREWLGSGITEDVGTVIVGRVSGPM